MSILNIIFNTYVCARTGARVHTHGRARAHTQIYIYIYILKRSYTNKIDYSERGYTLTM